MNTEIIALPVVSLFCKEGNSDKEYHIQVVQKEEGYVCNFQYGRRGSTLVPGQKPATSIALEKAIILFEQMKSKKLANGYKLSLQDPSLIGMVDSTDTGKRPMLLNPIEEIEVSLHITDHQSCMQEKKDGKRIMLSVDEGQVVASNRNGLVCPVPQGIIAAALQLPVKEVVLDGELIGEFFYVFDLISLDGKCYEHHGFLRRYEVYSALLHCHDSASIRSIVPLECYLLTEEKQRQYNTLKSKSAEGVVFKRINEPYASGRPSSGGPALKFKFLESSSCIVQSVSSTKRSIGLSLLDGNGIEVNVGNVTVPVNQLVPSVGEIVEIRYLYKFEGGCLFQPVLLGKRDDISHQNCHLTQVLRIKSKLADFDV